MASLLAHTLVVVHLAWVLFMVGGVLATLGGLWKRSWWSGRWRTLHLGGLLFAGVLSVTGQLCPLTHLEYALKAHSAPAVVREGFLVRWVQRLIYPEIGSLTLAVATLAAALLVLGIYLWMPPHRARRLLQTERLNPRTARPTSP